MSVDKLLALEARDNLLWIVAHWDELTTALHSGGGNALTGLPSGDGDPLVINVNVSDLMRDIEDKIARFYAHILADETDWKPTSRMPALLREVARRYGHFTEDDQLGIGFCDDAHEYREKVEGVLFGREPRRYVGPCPEAECVGELYLRDDRVDGKCPVCGTVFDRWSQRQYLRAEFEDRLMTLSEITSSLRVLLDVEVPYRTVQGWARRGKIGTVDGLYRLADALDLAHPRDVRHAT